MPVRHQRDRFNESRSAGRLLDDDRLAELYTDLGWKGIQKIRFVRDIELKPNR